MAKALRGGEVVIVPASELVPGDVVELRPGDLVPADGVIVQSRELHVNEALMTGEPFPVEKRAGASDATDPADAGNALFAGTSVVNGEASILVVATENAPRLGGVAAALGAAEPPSAFERGIARLGLLILRLTVFLTLFVLLVHLAFGRPVLESFLFAVALAVGLTPELLPMIMTVTLSRGALRMAAKSVVVKRLAAIHDLGAMSVLCTDKTGTLTQARITLIGYPGVDGRDRDRVLELAAVNAGLGSGIRSPLDQAILDRLADRSLPGWIKRDEIPFDFQRRCVSVLAERAGASILVVKGAPEAILARATAIELGDGSIGPLEEGTRNALEQLQRQHGEQGNRLLLVAWKAMPPTSGALRHADEADLVVAGFCVFVDPPKPSAAAATQRLAALGVRVKIVSGDHETVVRHVGENIGIPAGNLLTGAELARMTDSALVARVEDTHLFARVSPDQKTRIIAALQARGHIVGFIGDGVNDAPAIRTAEIGLSVEGATDVARAAADMIMLSSDLGVLAEGVEEGRRTFANILKYVRMGTSSNFGNMLSMAFASLLLPFLPLLPVQILLNNLLYDLSEIGIPFDRVDEAELSRPHGWDMGEIVRFTLVMGALSSLFDIATFTLLARWFEVGPEAFRTAWFIESTATQILVIFVIRTKGTAWVSRAHPVLTASSIAALCAALAIALSPVGTVFGFAPVSPAVLIAMGALVVVYLLAAEAMKARAMRWSGTA